MSRQPPRGRADLLRPSLLAVAAVAGANILSASGSTAFRPYYGALHPGLATGVVALAGVGALAFLQSAGWFEIRREGERGEGFRWAAILATLLALPVIGVDVLGGFPHDINVVLPEAILFYPVIALVAVMAFHVLPVAVLLSVLGRAADRLGREKVQWIAIVLASSTEPVFQVLAARGDSPVWVISYVGIHLTVFNLLALYLFKRFDFVTLYLFRVIYYLHWHLLWGWARLQLLF